MLLIPILVLAAGWKAVESYIDIEYYRPIIDKELELLIELPLEFGAMDLQLLPTPRLVVENVALGENDFMAFSPKVVVTADLSRLIHKKLELQVVSIHSLRVQLPEATPALQERWSKYMLALDTPDPSSGKPMLKVTLEQIVAEEAQVFRGATQYATGDLEVSGVTTGAPNFRFSMLGDGIEGAPNATGEFTLTVDSDPLLQGTASVVHLPLANLTGEYAIPDFLLDGELQYAQAQDDAWTFGATGTLSLDEAPEPMGAYTLSGGYGNGHLKFEQIQVTSTPISFRGAFELDRADAWKLEVASAALKDHGIAWLTGRLPEIPLLDAPRLASEGVLTDVVMLAGNGDEFQITQGTIAFRGVDLRISDTFLLPDVQGMTSIKDNEFTIAALVSRHLDVVGRLGADFDAGAVSLDLAGLIQLHDDFPLPDAVASDFRTDSGTIDLRELHAEIPGGSLDFPSLRLEAVIQDTSVAAWDDHSQTFTPIPNVSGLIRIETGTIELADLTSAYSVLSATLTPDSALERWSFAGTLKSQLSSPLWKPLLKGTGVTLTAGNLECSQLEGAFVSGTYTPDQLKITATIADLEATLDRDGFQDQLKLDSVAFTADSEHLTATLKGASEVFGPINGEGDWTLETGDIAGTLTLDLARSAGLPSTYRDGVLGTAIAQLSPLPLTIAYRPASNLISFSAEAPIPLSGTLSLTKEEAFRAPVGLNVSASFPVEWLAPALSLSSQSGLLTVQCQVEPRDGSVVLSAIATDAELGWPLLRKPSGVLAELSMEGNWEAGGPALSKGQLRLADLTLPIMISDGGVGIQEMDLDLAQLSPLLPEGASLSGSLRGNLEHNAESVQLSLGRVEYRPSPEAPVLGASGEIARDVSGWSVESMEWSADASRGSAELRQTPEGWRGALKAEHIDVNELTRAYGHLKGPDSRIEPDGAVRNESKPLMARLQVSAKSLKWEEATVERVRGALESNASGIALTDLSFVHDNGAGAGELVYVSRGVGNTGTIEAEVNLIEVGADLFEDLLMSDARDLEGVYNATARLIFPLPAKDESIMNGMSGQVLFDATDGTLGKAGLASKLLTALRTTDILRLRIPHLRDRGLTFETLSGEIAIEAGVFTLSSFHLADSAYVLEARGQFDFPQDLADGDVEVQVLEGVTGVARKIPILGDAAGMVSKMFRVPIKITGTATDPGFRVGMPGQ